MGIRTALLDCKNEDCVWYSATWKTKWTILQNTKKPSYTTAHIQQHNMHTLRSFLSCENLSNFIPQRHQEWCSQNGFVCMSVWFAPSVCDGLGGWCFVAFLKTSEDWITRRPAGCRCGWPDPSSCSTGFYPSQCRLPSSPCRPPGARPPDRNGTPALSTGCPASVSLPPVNRQKTFRKQK